MTLQWWFSFVVFSFTFCLIPGPSVCFTIAYAVRHGTKETLASIGGQMAANGLQILAVTLGLSQLVGRSAGLFTATKLAGAAYLVFLGVMQWRAQPTPTVAPTGGPHVLSGRAFWKGLAVCGANPKALLFYSAILPQFIAPDGSQLLQLALLGATNVMVGGLVLLAYAVMAGRFRCSLRSLAQSRVGARIAGGLMIAAGAYLALGRRT